MSQLIKYVIVLAILSGPAIAWTQCGQVQQVLTIQCPSACQQQYQTIIPVPSPYGFQFRYGMVQCCGSNVPYYYVYSGCQPAALKDKKVQAALKLFSRAQPLLIADCEGKYHPYFYPNKTSSSPQFSAKASLRRIDIDKMAMAASWSRN